LRPHAETRPDIRSLAMPLLPGEPIRIVIIGTIVAIKGAERLLACARDARTRKLPLEFHVIGSTDRDAALSRLQNVCIHGRYQERDVYDRVAAARCHLAFLPSLCPETFSYTLSIAMAARLYTLCFDLGAQAQRVRSWGWGNVLPLESGPDAINEALLAAARYVASSPAAPSPPPPAGYPDLLGSYYSFSADEQERIRGPRKRPAGKDPNFMKRNIHAYFH
jgi:glycosyltransferase involved in cell wall biosynthesis